MSVWLYIRYSININNKYLLLLDYLALYNRHIQVITEYFVVVY